MRRRVLSFDLDNCLFHEKYSSALSRDILEVVNKNKALLDSILMDRMNFQELIVLVGSARQSAFVDRLNSKTNQTESGFAAIQKISDYIDATLNTFLLADVYGDVPDGTAFRHALDSSYCEKHHDWIFDETKITIVYAQTHKIATMYPDDVIIFDFYDDRGIGSWGDIDILEHLEHYFGTYSTMLPSNVSLRLNHYEGKEVTSFKLIQGAGRIDLNYRQTIKKMMMLAEKTSPLSSNSKFFKNSVIHVKPESLFDLSKVIESKPKTLEALNPCDCISSCFRSIFSFFYIDRDINSPDEEKEALKLL